MKEVAGIAQVIEKMERGGAPENRNPETGPETPHPECGASGSGALLLLLLRLQAAEIIRCTLRVGQSASALNLPGTAASRRFIHANSDI